MGEDTYISKSLEETQNIASNFSKKLTAGDILALHGELGSGKTTFVQEIASALGVKERIVSPTFLVVRSYELGDEDIKRLFHLDLYRLMSIEDAQSFGVQEILKDEHAIVAIEWAEKIRDLLPETTVDIFFEQTTDNERRIIIKNGR